MIYEFNHYGIVIKNLDRSMAFYEGVLGAKLVYRGLIPATQTDVIYYNIAGGLIELLHRKDPPETETFGITHLAFLSDDLDRDYARLTGAGHTGLVAPKVAGTGVGRLAFLSDPNGARVELIQRDAKMRDVDYRHQHIQSFDHYSLTANDLAAARAFYQGLLGMTSLKEMQVAASSLSMVYLHYGFDVLELLHRPTPNTTDSIYGHVALRVGNVDAAQAHFAQQGIPAEPGMPKVAGTGIGRIGMIRDPDGVKIELVDRADLRDL
jgi:catechol 2,3-dioxygenase-like lactoylglutathione lyase family enzyme